MNVFDVIGIVAIPVAILCFHNWIIGERLSEAESRINSLTIQQMNSRPTFQGQEPFYQPDNKLYHHK